MSEPTPDEIELPDTIMEQALALQPPFEPFSVNGSYDPVEELAQKFKRSRQARELDRRRQFGITQNTWAPRDITKTVTGVYAGTIQAPRPSRLCHADGGPCLFYDGRINGVFGAYGGGKTWVALLAVRDELLRGKVAVYVDFEDDERGIITRLHMLGVPQDSLKHLRYVHPDAAPSDEEYLGLLKLVEDTRATLVVVDSVGEWLGLAGVEGNGDAQVAEWAQRWIKRLVRWGACALLLDHVPHEENGHHVLRAIGSQRKMAAVTGSAFRAVVVEEPGRGRRGVVQLVGAKDRHGYWARGVPAADVVIDAMEEDLKVEVRPPRAPVAPDIDELLIALNRAGDGGLTAEEGGSVLVGGGWRPRNFSEQTTAEVLARSAERQARRRLQLFVTAQLATFHPARRGGSGAGAQPARWVITGAGHERVEPPEEAVS